MTTSTYITTVVYEEQLTLKALCDWETTQALPIQQALLDALVQYKGSQVILDLTGIQRVDSLGLKLIIGLFKTCQQQQWTFCVENQSPHIARVLQICGLNKMINVKEVSAHG